MTPDTGGPTIDDVLTAISDGRLDPHLAALAQAITDRDRTRADEQARSALQHLAVGGRVRLDGQVKPRYLQNATGTIHHIDGTTVTVHLDTPTGRFTNGHVSCSARTLHPINQPET